MKFSIHLGIPEILALWTRLKKSNAEGTISKSDAQLYKKWGKTMKLLSENPFYPSLNTHEISDLTKRYGMKVWQSYLENKTSRTMRMYWMCGPDHKAITVIGLEPHPEDKKNGAYAKFSLSDMPPLQQ